MPERAPIPFGQFPQGIVPMPQEAYQLAGYAKAADVPLMVNVGSASAGSGTGLSGGTVTLSRGAPMYGDLVVVCVGSGANWGGSGLAHADPPTSPSGGGVTEFAKTGQAETGGTQSYLSMWVGRVDSQRSPAVTMAWYGAGVGHVAVFRGLRGIIRDWNESATATSPTSGLVTTPVIGDRGWGDFGGIVVAGSIHTGAVSQAPLISIGDALVEIASTVNTNTIKLLWARYSGGSFTVSAQSATGTLVAAAAII